MKSKEAINPFFGLDHESAVNLHCELLDAIEVFPMPESTQQGLFKCVEYALAVTEPDIPSQHQR